MMWRGTIFSTLLHGSIVIAIVVGIPVLPKIFDRENEIEAGGVGQSISIEIVSADSLDLRQNVVAPQKPSSDSTGTTSVTGALPTLQLGPEKPTSEAEDARPPDSQPPAQAAKTRIPGGALSKPQSERASSILRTPGPRRQSDPSRASAARKPQQAKQRSELKKTAAQTRTQEQGQTQAQARAQVQQTDQRPASASTNTRSAAAVAASKTQIARTTPASEPRTQEQKPVGATGSDTPRSRGSENEFVRSVRGEKRDLVIQVLDVDTRTRQAVTARKAHLKSTKQARARTLQRLRKATAAGYPHAQYNLAGKYLRGEDVEKSPEEARKLLARAAQQGYVPAQSLLALMYFTGFGVPQDQAEAAFWWSLAADGGDDGAKIAVELVQKLLKPREFVKTRRLRARWGSLIADLAELTAGNTNRKDLDAALRTASEKGDLDAVLALLSRGADADEAGDEGRSAVINAAWRGRKRIIDLLLERGVATELPDDDGRTPLMWAAINGHIDIVRQLVRNGANPNHVDTDGGTALIRAAWNGHTAAVRDLIDAGADVTLRDGNGLNALDHARREGNAAIVNALRAAGAR